MSVNKDFDAMIIEMKGGEPEPSYLKRWTLTNGELFKTEMIKSSRSIERVSSINVSELAKLSNEITSESYLQVCPYASDSNLFLFLIKKKSGIFFKYSSSENYKSLDKKDLEQIKSAATIFDMLQNGK